ncbi:MAG: SHOCT domain-containing protein [Deltaproteobacteria bacterium]|nr:SHOCT domain-containing protein [Deltaproteobacteria bacterium]
MFAYGGVWNGFHWWWLIPIALMLLCFLMMPRRGGCMMRKVRSPQAGESAREILDKRYARGEIGKEEYEEKKRDMS